MEIGILLLIIVFTTLFTLPFLCWLRQEIIKIDWELLGNTKLGKKVISLKENTENSLKEKIKRVRKTDDEDNI